MKATEENVSMLMSRFSEIIESQKTRGLDAVPCLNRNQSFDPDLCTAVHILDQRKCFELWVCQPEELALFLSWIDEFVADFELEKFPLLKTYVYLESLFQISVLGSCSEYASIVNSLIYAYNSALIIYKEQGKYQQESNMLPSLIEDFQNSLFLELYFQERNFSYRAAAQFLYERIRKIIDNNKDLLALEKIYRRKK